MSTDLFKSALSGFIAGVIGGALSPFFKGASLMAEGPSALKLLAKFVITVIGALLVTVLCKVIAEEVMPEGSFEDMSGTDRAWYAVGIFFDALEMLHAYQLKPF